MTPLQTPSHVALCGTGVAVFVNETADLIKLVPLRCHRWDCDFCSRVRMREARAKAAAGKPERLITTTTRPREGLSLEAAIPWIRKSWTLLLRRIRKEYPRIEYMAFVELHKSGWPHMHILTRGAYVPQRVLSTWWADITGSFKVHIQKVKAGWHGIQEATKYYLKTARQVHAAAPSLPVYTMSRGWLPSTWHERERPPGNWSFFAYCRLSMDAAAETVAELGGSLEPMLNEKGNCLVTMRGPPNPEKASEIYYRDDPGQCALVSALQTFAEQGPDSGRTLPELAARYDYATGALQDPIDPLPPYIPPGLTPRELEQLTLLH